MLEGKTGKVKKTLLLPDDNFYIIKALGEPTLQDEAAVVIKNGEAGYHNWRYGEPVIGLNANLEIVWEPKAVIGGGHHILATDINGDGRKEYIIGYCAVSRDGKVLWTVDSVDPSRFVPESMHVDYTDFVERADGRKILAIAGSDRLFVVTDGGNTIFEKKGLHAQGAAIDNFISDDAFHAVCYNAPNGPMTLYDMNGNRVWSRITPRKWPMGVPAACKGRRFHRNRPIVAIFEGKKHIGFADGGWPWAMNGQGKIDLKFAFSHNGDVFPAYADASMRVRGDDLGLGYAMQCIDLDGDGNRDVAIYNRTHMWIYHLC